MSIKAKTKKNLIILLACVMAVAMLAFVGVACDKKQPKATFEFENTSIVLDRYEELVPTLVKGDIKDIKFTSANNEIVSVSGNRLVAEREGNTTVTASKGGQKVSLSVKVIDSGTVPRLQYETGKGAEAYLGTFVPMLISVRYNGEIKMMEYTYDNAVISNASLAVFEDGQIKGLALGETTVSLTVEYKGLSLRLSDVKLIVKEQAYIEMEKEELSLHNVNEGKLGKYTLNAAAYNCGKVVEGASINYAVSSGTDVVEIIDGVVYARTEGSAVITASYFNGNVTVSKDLPVTVLPNYKADVFIPAVGNGEGVDGAYYAEYDGTVDGRTGVMEYHPGSQLLPSSTGSYPTVWQHRVCLPEGKAISDKVREGCEYFGFDVYYASDSQTYIGLNTFVSWLPVNTYFRRNCFKILNADGDVINYLPKNQWVTFVYDLRAYFDYTTGATSIFWFVNTDKDNSCYVDNIRWYLDDAFINSENLVYENKGDYVQATNDEFDVRYPTVETPPTYTKGGGAGRTDAYVYTATSNSALNNSLVVATSLNENYDEGFYRLRKKGATLAYDVYIDDADTVTFTMFANANVKKQKQAVVSIGKGGLSEHFGWLKIIDQNGKVCSNLERQKWYTVQITYLPNYEETCSSSQILFSASNAGDKVYIDNVRYLKTAPTYNPDDYQKELNYVFGNTSANVAWDTSFEDYNFAYYKILATEASNVVRFSSVTTEKGLAGTFFNGSNRFVKVRLFIAKNVTSIKVCVDGAGLAKLKAELVVGQPVPNGVYVLDDTLKTVTTFTENSWHTLFIPITVTGTVTSPNVYLSATGGTKITPAEYYIGTLQNVSEVNPPSFISGAPSDSELTFIESGEFAGSYKFTTTNKGEGGNYGMSGVSFEGIRDSSQLGGRFFIDGNKYIKVDVYLDESVKALSIRSTDSRYSSATQGDMSNYWKQRIAVNGAIPADVYLYENGVKATTLQTGKWYTLYIPVNYSNALKVHYPVVCIYPTNNDSQEATTLYLKNVEYLKQMP